MACFWLGNTGQSNLTLTSLGARNLITFNPFLKIDICLLTWLVFICICFWKIICTFQCKVWKTTQWIHMCVCLLRELLASVQWKQHLCCGIKNKGYIKKWRNYVTQTDIFIENNHFWIMKFRAMNFHPHFRCTGICCYWQPCQPIAILEFKFWPIGAQGADVIGRW